MGSLPAYVCAPHVCSAPGCQKKALIPLELEFYRVVSHHMCAGRQIGSSARAGNCLKH